MSGKPLTTDSILADTQARQWWVHMTQGPTSAHVTIFRHASPLTPSAADCVCIGNVCLFIRDGSFEDALRSAYRDAIKATEEAPTIEYAERSESGKAVNLGFEIE